MLFIHWNDITQRYATMVPDKTSIEHRCQLRSELSIILRSFQ